MSQTRIISPEELAAQRPYTEWVRAHYASTGVSPLAYIRSFGCQQNVADAERIKGMLAEMGFGFTDDPAEADFILFNLSAKLNISSSALLENETLSSFPSILWDFILLSLSA